MHNAAYNRQADSEKKALEGLQHLSLELTAGCNERCVHCCVSSGPERFKDDKLARQDYQRLLSEANALGARSVQFIGGEPATKKYELASLITQAHDAGYKHIEVYTNLTILPDFLLDTFKKCGVHVASSFYSCDEQVHDGITKLHGSHRMTSRNMRRVLEAQLPLRVGVIEMPENTQTLTATLSYLDTIGVKQYGVDRVRGVGRGTAGAGASGIEQLCHQCWRGGLTVASDGTTYPCTVGREFPVGNVLTSALQDIVHGDALKSFRKESYAIYARRKESKASCEIRCTLNCSPTNDPDWCDPYCSPSIPFIEIGGASQREPVSSCEIPCELNCGPTNDPNWCSPDNRCNPELGLPPSCWVRKHPENIAASECKPVNPSQDNCEPDVKKDDGCFPDCECYPNNA